ncbi:MAG TPA: histidine kinase [Lachnospiraceae bacterium]|nr:histidine kinase [Lachnospiraceae bacterium]
MKEKNYSIQKVFNKNLLILLITSLFSLILFGIFSYWTGLRQIENSNRLSSNIYIHTLQSEMSEISNFNLNLCYNDKTFQLLSTGFYDDSQKIIYEYNLRNVIKSEVSPYSAILIFDSKDNISMYQYGSLFPSQYAKRCYDFKEELKTYLLASDMSSIGVWQTYSNEYFSVLLNTCQYNGLYICYFIDLNFFSLQNYDSDEDIQMQICFFDQQRILSNLEEMQKYKVTYNSLINNNSIFKPNFLYTAPIKNTDISIACVMPITYLWFYIRVSVFAILLMICVFCILYIVMFLSFKDVLSYPINQISSAAVSLEQNDMDLFITSNKSNIIEFQKINDALSNLVHQKVLLEEENHLEKNAKSHAMLQYFQLQTKSHFFINCLKSLYSMLEIKEYEKMQRMIMAFSNHLRYIFHDNLKLVSLDSELAEVNDYYNIILMDRSKPILLMQNISEDLMNVQVPPLLIQTFLENSIKYNAQTNKLLCFNIHIEKTILDEHDVLQIRLSDNGVGYEQHMLDKLNCEESDLFEDYHVGITNLKKRIQLIYKTGFHFVFYNEPTGGACTLIYLPMEDV